MDPELFLSLALTLKSTTGRPEFYRTAISRAYYAAFNVGIQVLATRNFEHPRAFPLAHIVAHPQNIDMIDMCLRGLDLRMSTE